MNPIMTRPLNLIIIIYAIPDSKVQNDIDELITISLSRYRLGYNL